MNSTSPKDELRSVADNHTTYSTGPKRGFVPCGLSVDVEDYFHVEAFADRIHAETWPRYPSRVLENTRRVMRVFEDCGAHATFFVLGYVAEKEPSLVREIVAAGHEIGCHSHMHRRVFKMTPKEFREDLHRATGVIEDAGGQKVVGYRAPTFSIVEESLWALEILADEGFLYDSSIFPVRHDLYGMPNAPRFPYRWKFRDGRTLIEIPPSTVRFAGRNWPAAGGGYLRILPMAYTRWALNRVQQRDGKPAVIYFHPWEIDPDQPRLSGSLKSRLRHYSNLGVMEKRVRMLLGKSRFVSFKSMLESYPSQELPTLEFDVQK